MTRTDDSVVPDYHSRLRLDGKRFVVLGAGQGMGRQASHALAQSGARLVCVDREADLADDIASEVDGTAWSGDMTKGDDVARLFDDAARQLGGLDGIVDIIGIARWVPIVECTEDDWDFQQDMNLRHAFYAIRHGAPNMTDGGVIVFVASVSGLSGAPNHGPYGAAKAGLMALVKTAAQELASRHIRVNAVAPGPILTPRMQVHMSEQTKANNAANVPIGRMGVPADIASALLFLATDLSAFVNGQTIVADGGVGVKFPYPEQV